MTKNLQQLFEEYIYECEFSRKLSAETLRGYVQTFSTFNKFLPNTSVQTLTSLTVTRFFEILHERKRIVGKGMIKTGIRKSSLANYWSRLNNFFEWLLMKKHIRFNPFREMIYPSHSYEDLKFLKKNEVEKIVSAIHNNCWHNSFLLKRNLVIFYLLLFCGLRRTELLLLQIRDIDFDNRILTIRAETSKIPRTRYVPLHSQLLMYLKEYLRERKSLSTPFLIASSKLDDKLSHDGLKHLVEKLKDQSQVKFHLHQFRHTFAVNFLMSSNNIVKLKQLMGHKDIRMTMVYLRCLPTNEMRGDIENMNIDSFV